jgi:hypothetical protein
MSEDLASSNEPALLALQAVEDLSLPALLDSLDPHRRDVDRHSVLESWAQESVHVRVCRPILAAVLMDGEDTLNSPRCATEGPIHGIAENALGKKAVEALEPFRRRVIHGHDEAPWVPIPVPVRIASNVPRRLFEVEGRRPIDHVLAPPLPE